MRSSRSFRRVCRVVAIALAASSAVAIGTAQTPPQGPRVLRVWGYTGLSAQLLRWESAYTNAHPDVTFVNELHSPAVVMAGLYDRVADIVLMGREIWPVETMAYHWIYQQQPFGLTLATSGLNAPGQSFTPVVIVNRRNPLGAISLSQLDAIYGSEHRNAPANIRTWGELGLTGAWAAKPIHVYGYGPEDALGVYFRHDVLRGDFKPNIASHLLSDRDPGHRPAADRILTAVAADPFAIGYTRLPANASAKVLALEPDTAAPPTAAELADHSYGLTRSLSAYILRLPGQPITPAVDGFMRFVLSAEGQQLVAPAEGFLPLTPKLVQQQLHKLDAPMPPDGTPAVEE